jgi:mRNA export factor
MVQYSAKIIDLQNPPADTVSEMAFSPLHNLMATSSWDSSIRIYDPTNPYSASNNTVTNTAKPLLTCCFSTEVPSQAFAGAADGSLHMLDLQTSQLSSFQAHNEGVKAVRFYQNMLVSGSWDKTVKFWDIRTGKPVFSLDLPGKVYAMDLESNMLALSLSDNNVVTYNLTDINQKKMHTSKLNWMVRSLACSSDNETFALGGIEGKCEIININSPVKRMVFRCHRIDNRVYSVNSVSFFPNNANILATAGGDGSLLFFDSQSRLKVYTHKENDAITCAKFTPNGAFYAYATGHDWSTGYTSTYKPVNLKVVQVSTTGIKM